MSDAAHPSPTLEEVARAVLELAREPLLERVLARFLEAVRAWAAPSAVLAAVEDATQESGWRLLTSLCAGSGPLDAGQSVRQLVEELPGGLGRPALVRPAGAGPGVRARENCVVPWSWEGQSGVLILRGVAETRPAQIAEALALLSAPVWPRLLGGPTKRVEAGVAQLRELAERLRDDAERQLERLQAARTPVPVEEREDEERRAQDEALRRQLWEAEDRGARAAFEREELRQQVADLEKALATAEEERAEALAAAAVRPGDAAEPLRRTLSALRRTPFLPPPLRVVAQDAEAALGAPDPRPGPRGRVALLDRDVAGLEPLADELEADGIDVKLASHPEELALLLRTPEGRALDAAICDVLAFRPDQTVAGIFRGWEKDRPGLALYLSFSRDVPAEVERAQRVPLSLTRGRFQRPLRRGDLMELLEPLLRPAP